jgi:hypothetical protein
MGGYFGWVLALGITKSKGFRPLFWMEHLSSFNDGFADLPSND